MKNSRMRQRTSPRLSVRTTLVKRTVVAASVIAVIAVILSFTYSNFFSVTDSKAGGSAGFSKETEIRLGYFRATPTGTGMVKIEWSSFTEAGSDYYSIDRGIDGTEFSAIGVVEAAGNSSRPTYYTFIDSLPLEGANYYRLRQTDYRGWSVLNEVIPLAIVSGTPERLQFGAFEAESDLRKNETSSYNQ